MRWLILLMVFFASCGNGEGGKKLKADSPNPGLALVAKLESDTFHLVDTVDFRTKGGQVIHFQLLYNWPEYYWVLGTDTIIDRHLNSSKFENLKSREDLYDFFFNFLSLDDSAEIHYHEPIIPVRISALSELMEMPDSVLENNYWLVAYPSPDSSESRICRASVQLLQLDTDPVKERIVCISGNISMGGIIYYYVFDNQGSKSWEKVGEYSDFNHNGPPCDSIIYQYPYFGFFDHGWGSAYGSDNLTIFRLGKDSMIKCLCINELNAYHGFPCINYDNCEEKFTKNSRVLFRDNHFVIEYYVYSRVNWPTEKSKYYLLNGEYVSVSFYYDEKKKVYTPSGGSFRWMTSYGDDEWNFDLDSYIDFRLKQLARTGTSTQRKILKNYPD